MLEQLNEEQRTLLTEVLIPFFRREGDFAFKTSLVISAPAGTGKTFLMKTLLEQMPEETFVLCATTHKAAEQLSLQTGREVSTVHSLYGIRVYSNYKTGQDELDFSKANVISCANIICDECSMIDYQLFRYMKSHSIECRFLFIGDDRQLPPVNCKLSPVFTENDGMYTLTQLMRQNGKKELEAICAIYRDTVETHNFPKIEVSGSIQLLNRLDFNDKIAEYFKEPTLDHKVLCFTNRKVVDYSTFIAEVRQEKDFLTVGNNYLINNALITDNADKDKQHVLIQNNSELPMLDMEDKIYEVDDIGLKYRNVQFNSSITGEDIWCETAVDKDAYFKALKQTAKSKDWHNYFKLKNSFLDLRYRDSSTVHKAQGMTLDTVFIDLDDLGTCKQYDTFARLIYVAVSRARNQIYFTGSLPERFGSIANED